MTLKCHQHEPMNTNIGYVFCSTGNQSPLVLSTVSDKLTFLFAYRS